MVKNILLLTAIAGVGAYAQANSATEKIEPQKGLTERHERTLTAPRFYVCQRAAEPIKIDGKLTEKSWELAERTQPFVDISGEDFPTPKYETYAKMLWDDDYLYVGAVLQEDDIKANITQRDDIIYHDNDFEVFIDPDGDGMNYFEIENNAYGVVFDLMLDKAYRSGGNFMIQYDCPGLILKTSLQGTINKSSDTDKSWTVEMAIPHKALTVNFNNPLKAGNVWRLNFSRVEWLKEGGPEENWVWSPTGKVDMHMPDRWGFVAFSPVTVGTQAEAFQYPYNMDIYKTLWAMFYEQLANQGANNNFLRNIEQFCLTPAEMAKLPEGATIDVDAATSTFTVSITDPKEGKTYSVNQNGKFSITETPKREIKNFVWSSPHAYDTPAEWQAWFKMLKENGITGVMFEGYDTDLYKMCKEAGLEAHHWKWTMNRKEVLDTHPDWFAVNRKGESCYDQPAYVDYYRFLCPNHDGVATYLAEDYVEEMNKPYVDGVHLDYVRMPDVILPTDLWKNYGIEQTTELPEYDFCYCDVCREKYKAQHGKDPLELEFPMNTPTWTNFRLNSITNVVDSITEAVKSRGGYITAAVFPGPSMARSMVRQDWGKWNLDAYYPMIYNGFYGEGIEWIGESTKESVDAVGDRSKIYTGMYYDDIKDCLIPAVEQALDNGASGVSFFQAPDEEHLKMFKAYLDEKGYIVK